MLNLTPLEHLSTTKTTTIGVIMTSHNRRRLTLRCIQTLVGQEINSTTDLAIVLVDDASRDGTSEAVQTSFPAVQVVNGTGGLYWGGGMRLAHYELIVVSEPDYLLWLNDDVILRKDALEVLLRTAVAQPDSVVVGALLDPHSQETSYSGLNRRGRSPLGVDIVTPSGSIQEVDTFNGNVVLVPQTAYRILGAIDPKFPHQFGDLDYGYRARKVGISMLMAPTHVGWCERNEASGTWQDPSLRPWQRVRHLHSVKVMPLLPRLEFLRRHGGLEWPLQLVVGYLKTYIRIMYWGKR